MTRSIPIGEVVSASRLGLAMIAAESAGYVMLGAVDALIDAPAMVDARSVLVSDEGTVTVRSPIAASSQDSAAACRRLLKSLLTSVTSPTPGLMGVVSRSGGDLRQLVTELEAALVPVNRAAARRTLARLAREGLRALDQGVLGPRDMVAELAAAATTMEARPRASRVAEPEPVRAVQPQTRQSVSPPPAPVARPATPAPIAPSRPASRPPSVAAVAQASSQVETPVPLRISLPPPVLEPFPERVEAAPATAPATPAFDPFPTHEACVPIDDAATPLDAAAPVMDLVEPPADPEAELTIQLPPRPVPVPDATDRLIASFETTAMDHSTLSASLKQLAGLEPTPPPPVVVEPPVREVLFREPPRREVASPLPPTSPRERNESPSAPVVQTPSASSASAQTPARTPGLDNLTRTPRSVSAPRRFELPEMDDEAFGLRPSVQRPHAPKLSLAVLFVLLLGGIAATLGVWVEHPEFFAGKSTLAVPR